MRTFRLRRIPATQTRANQIIQRKSVDQRNQTRITEETRAVYSTVDRD